MAKSVPITLEMALKEHQQGNLAEAVSLYQEILVKQPRNSDAHHLLGVLYHQARNYSQAIAQFQRAIHINPKNPDFYNNLGETYRLSGKFPEAIAQYQKALQLQPRNGRTRYNLGNALQAMAKSDQAIAEYQKALELIPDLAPAHHNLGFLRFQQGEVSQAIAHYRQALAINPQYLQALHSLGNALQKTGQLLEAINTYNQALKLNPQSPEIYNDLGNAFQANYDFERAIATYQIAIQLNLDFAEAYYNLGNALKVCSRTTEAELAYQRAILIKHDRSDWYITLGMLLKDQNKLTEAIAIFKTALIYEPNNLDAQFKLLLLLPIIYENFQQISQWRQRFMEGLHQLQSIIKLDTPEQIQGAVNALKTSTNFYLAYQAQNDLELQTQFGNLVHQIMAAAYPQFCQPLTFGKLGDRPIRLGFISSYFRGHTVGKLFLGWLQHCDRSQFQIYCYYTGKLPTPATDAFAAASDFIYHLPHLDTAIHQIAADQLDILVFTDLGMNPETTQVAALRLAPVQCLAWGHPVTSGLPTIDYFLSSELMEPEDGDRHYREQLVRLPNLSIYYPKPELPKNLLGRSQFQIPNDAVVYLCCQSLYKYLPQYDYIFVEIAKQVPNAKFIFISSNNGDYVTQQFQQRLQTAFAPLNSCQDYCLIMPRLNQEQYLNLNLLADIFLDTIAWSGGNTTLEAIACNLPIVTLPTQFMRGRHSYAMLRIMDIPETIAHSESEYIDIAVKLGLDQAWRAAIVEKVKNNSDRLYSDQICISALEQFFLELN